MIVNLVLYFQLFYAERHTALLLYSAATNGHPTGMLYRHYNLNAQADGVAEVIDAETKVITYNFS